MISKEFVRERLAKYYDEQRRKFFHSPQIVPVFRQEVEAGIQERLDYWYQNFNLETVTEDTIDHLISKYFCDRMDWNDVVDYKFSDTWGDGRERSISDIHLYYDAREPWEHDGKRHYSMVDDFGIDFIYLVGIELSKLADIPFMNSDKAHYGHDRYVFPHHGTYGSGSEGLNVCCYDHEGHQRCLESGTPFYREMPKWDTPHGYGDYPFEKVTMYVYNGRDSEGKDIYDYVDGYKILLAVAVDELHDLYLNYYEKRTVTTDEGDREIPERGSIGAVKVKKTARLMALHMFDRYYGMKPVPRGEAEC